MPRFQHGGSMVDQMTRLKLKLLETRLENEKCIMDDRAESAQSTGSYYDGQLHQLHRALYLLRILRDQHMLEELNTPHNRGGSQRHYKSHPLHQPTPALSFLPHPPPVPLQPPHIIQQTLPKQPATITQQQPLITPPQPDPAPRSDTIKEGVVELMLMQNAQMHQIIMHNMMLKAMPPLWPPGHCTPRATYLGQDSYQGNPIFTRPDVSPRGSGVHHHHHHHHHYGPTTAAPQLPHISHPTCPQTVSYVPAEHAAGHLPSIHHVTAPFTLPPLNA